MVSFSRKDFDLDQPPKRCRGHSLDCRKIANRFLCNPGSGLRPARDMDPKYPIIPFGFYPIQVDIVGQCYLAGEAAVIDLHGYNSNGLHATHLYFRFRTRFRRSTVSADEELSVADRKLDLFRIYSCKIGADAKAARAKKHVHRGLPPVLNRMETREIDACHLISHVS
jgi:hypothetical protein